MFLLLLSAVMSFRFFGTSNGMPPHPFECQTKDVMCNCGRNPVVHHWKVLLCQETEEQYCARFQDCEECHPDGDLFCKSCPPQKFGLFCENRCSCENGGICDNNGRCMCPEAFEGPLCDQTTEDTDEPYCGIASTETGQWPWRADVFWCDDDEDRKCAYECGGSLLNNLWVITAAECLTYVNATYGRYPKDAMTIFLGKYYSDFSKDDSYVQVRKVDEYYIHPDFRNITSDANIALIKLNEPVEMSLRVQPVCLPTVRTSESNLVEGNYGVVTGWTMNEDYNYAETLGQAAVPVVSERYCNRASLLFDVTENMFCTAISEPFTPETYYVDIGDPIYFRDTSAEETPWVIEGIETFDAEADVENGNFVDIAVYTRVSKFLDWIWFYIKKS